MPPPRYRQAGRQRFVYSSAYHCRSCPLPSCLCPSLQWDVMCQSCTISWAAGFARPTSARLSTARLGPPTLPPPSLGSDSVKCLRHFAATSIYTLHSVHFLPHSLLDLTYECLFGMLLTSCFNLTSSHSALSLSLSLPGRCKEGYHGLRCDQFVPKTDAILSDPSTSKLFFVFQSQIFYLGLVFLFVKPQSPKPSRYVAVSKHL